MQQRFAQGVRGRDGDMYRVFRATLRVVGKTCGYFAFDLDQ